jgi:hypothetical protein
MDPFEPISACAADVSHEKSKQERAGEREQ